MIQLVKLLKAKLLVVLNEYRSLLDIYKMGEEEETITEEELKESKPEEEEE